MTSELQGKVAVVSDGARWSPDGKKIRCVTRQANPSFDTFRVKKEIPG